MLLSDSGGTVMIIQLLNTLLFKFYEYFLYMTFQQEVALERWLEYESETITLSQILYEELRLLLLPTKAASLR